MSDTPRTKSEAIRYAVGLGHIACNRVEELETELAEKDREIERLKSEARDDRIDAVRQITNLEPLVDELRLENEQQQQLIEQMREALVKLIGTLEVMSVMPETIGKHPVLAMDAPELEQARAALEAAERGK